VQSLPLMLVAGVGLVLVAAKTLQFVQSRLLHRVSSLSLSKFNIVDVCVGILVSGSFMIYFGNMMHQSELQEGGGASINVATNFAQHKLRCSFQYRWVALR
jgi:hypothetical protein